MFRWISTAARLVSRAVGGKFVLCPSAASGGFALLGQLQVTIPGEISVSWLVITAPILLWLVFGLIANGVSLQRRLDLDPFPDISARDAFRHLMLDANWSIGRYVNPNEKSASNTTGGQLYEALEAEMRDKVRAGRLKVWARPQVSLGFFCG